MRRLSLPERADKNLHPLRHHLRLLLAKLCRMQEVQAFFNGKLAVPARVMRDVERQLIE
jgi:hypothetical protein